MKIGKGTKIPKIKTIWPHQIQIGNNCQLEDNIFLKFDGIYKPGPAIVIGNDCFIGQNCEFNIRKKIEIGGNKKRRCETVTIITTIIIVVIIK